MSLATALDGSEQIRTDTPDANNATFIYYQDVGENEYWTADFFPLNKREWWKKADFTNAGRVNGIYPNRPYLRHQENSRIFETIASQLELTEKQRIEAKCWFASFNLDEWGVPKEEVAHALCAYIVHSDGGDVRRCHPQTPDAEKDPLFLRMEEAVGFRDNCVIGKSMFDSLYGKIQDEIRSEETPPELHPYDRYAEFDGVSGPFITDSLEETRAEVSG